MKTSSAIILILLLCGCQSEAVQSEMQATPDGWSRLKPMTFKLQAPDSTQQYDLFLHVRNDENYAFSNLFLITTLAFPNGKQITDTLEYEMAWPDGKLMGHGMGSVKENKLWYKEGVRFRESGNYTLTVAHAMRAQGQVKGIVNLDGVREVGYSIEKHSNGKENEE